VRLAWFGVVISCFQCWLVSMELACFGVSFGFVPRVDSSVHGYVDAFAGNVYGADCCSNVE